MKKKNQIVENTVEQLSDENIFGLYERGLRAIFKELPEQMDEFMALIKSPNVIEFNIHISVKPCDVPTYSIETIKFPDPALLVTAKPKEQEND